MLGKERERWEREGGENDVRIYDGADDEGSGGGGGGEGREIKERKEGRTKKKSCRRSSEGRLSCEREQRWSENLKRGVESGAFAKTKSGKSYRIFLVRY